MRFNLREAARPCLCKYHGGRLQIVHNGSSYYVRCKDCGNTARESDLPLGAVKEWNAKILGNVL